MLIHCRNESARLSEARARLTLRKETSKKRVLQKKLGAQSWECWSEWHGPQIVERWHANRSQRGNDVIHDTHSHAMCTSHTARLAETHCLLKISQCRFEIELSSGSGCGTEIKRSM